MADFLSGCLFAVGAAFALYFWKFWRQTRDRLFALFSLAFVILATNREALTLLNEESESRTYVFLVRLFAFALILVAIIDKNRNGER